jgi:hypothetical protein
MTPDGLHAGPMVRPFLRWIYDACQDDYIGRCQTAAALHCTALQGCTRDDVCGICRH